MENASLSKTVMLSIFALGGVGFGIYLYVSNKNKREAEKADNAISNLIIDNLDSEHTSTDLVVTKFINIFKPSGLWVENINTEEERANLFNACLCVTDWANVQSKFFTATGNKIRLADCISQKCDTATANKAFQLAACKKIIMTKAATLQLQKTNLSNNKSEFTSKQFLQNTLIGAVKSENSQNYDFINGYCVNKGIFTDDLTEISGSVFKGFVKII